MNSVTLTSAISEAIARLEPAAAQAVSETNGVVLARMVATVAVDEGELQASIHEIGSGLDQGVEVGTDHAWPQEVGRPDLPNYTYTPFAKPSAEAERQNHKDRVAARVNRALR